MERNAAAGPQEEEYSRHLLLEEGEVLSDHDRPAKLHVVQAHEMGLDALVQRLIVDHGRVAFAHVHGEFDAVGVFQLLTQMGHGVNQVVPGLLVEGPHGAGKPAEGGDGVADRTAFQLAEFQHAAVRNEDRLVGVDVADEAAGRLQSVLSLFRISAVGADAFDGHVYSGGFSHHGPWTGRDFALFQHRPQMQAEDGLDVVPVEDVGGADPQSAVDGLFRRLKQQQGIVRRLAALFFVRV